MALARLLSVNWKHNAYWREVNIAWTGKLKRFLDARAFYARPIIML